MHWEMRDDFQVVLFEKFLGLGCPVFQLFISAFDQTIYLLNVRYIF